MADQKISQLPTITGANMADDDKFVLVDTSGDSTVAVTFSELKNAFDTSTGFVRITGDTMTGNLNVNANINSDGLTVETTADNGAVIQAHNNSTTTYPLKVQNNAGSGRLEIGTYGINNNIDLKIQTADTNRINVDTNGDISFYEDTGSTAKLMWKASEEELRISQDQAVTLGSVGGTGTLPYVGFGTYWDGSKLRAHAGSYYGYALTTDRPNNKVSLQRYDSNGPVTGNITLAGNSVGIGTDSPSHPLEVTKNTSGSQDIALLSNDNVGVGNTAGLLFAPSNGVTGARIEAIAIEDFSVSANRTADLAFHTRKDGTLAERLRIDSSGNVGIGTSSPSGKLTIANDDTGSLSTNLSDYSIVLEGAVGTGSYNHGIVFNEGATALAGIGVYDGGTGGRQDLWFATKNSSSTYEERMRIDSSGNVGIGIAAPDTIIHGAKDGGATLTLENTDTTIAANDLIGGIDFKGNDASEDGNEVLAYIRAKAVDATPDSYLSFGTLGNAGGVDDTVTERMRIDKSGNVGIGATPNTVLHVSTATTTKSVVETTGTSSDALIEFTRGQGSGNTWSVGLDQSNSSALSFAYLANGSPSLTSHNKMTLDASGNLSLGTSSTPATLTGTSTEVGIGFDGSSGYGAFVRDGSVSLYANRLTSDGTIQEFRKDGTTVGSVSAYSSNLLIGTGNTNLRFFDSSKIILPRTASNGASNGVIDLGDSGNRFKDLRLSGTAYSGHILAGATAQISTGSNLIKADGDTLALDVYTSTSTAGRDVFAVRSDIGGTEAKVGVIEANGDFQSATNSYGSISDQSVKQDIVDANSQMEDVKNIRLRNYRLIDHVTAYGEDAKVHLGVVAQELEAENMDGLVSENADGVKGVRYSVMLLKALGALQETITMVEDLQVENTQIKARLTALEG